MYHVYKEFLKTLEIGSSVLCNEKEQDRDSYLLLKSCYLTITVPSNIFFNKIKGLKGIKMDKIKNDTLDDLFCLEELGPEANLQLPDPILV